MQQIQRSYKKALIFFLFFILTNQSTQAQYVLTNPNKSINGLKVGLWSEVNISRLLDSTGNYYHDLDLHGTPKNVIAEGLYAKGEREGFWKEYWINVAYDSTPRFVRGGIKSLTEYKTGVLCGLVLEYYRNGNIKIIGQFETYPVNETQKFQVPDWTDPNFQTLKDTVVYIKSRSRPIGIWQFFKSDGTAWNRITYE